MDKVNVAFICNKDSWVSKSQEKLLERQLIMLFCNYETINFYTEYDSIFETLAYGIILKLRFKYGLGRNVKVVFLKGESFSIKQADVLIAFVPFPLSPSQIYLWHAKRLNKKYGKPKIINIAK